MEFYIYHYSKCKKSRAGLEYLRENKIDPVIISYIEEGVSPENLKELFSMLKTKPSEMVRKQEDYYKDELKYKDISEEEWLKILSDYPKLIRRPIIIYGKDSVIGDPPQNINQLLTAYKHDHENKN